MAAGFRFLWVGRLKEPFFQAAAEHYLKRLGRFAPCRAKVVKDAGAKLPPEEKSRQESAGLLKLAEPSDWLVVLDERGRSLGSRELAAQTARWAEMPGRTACFVVGGAFGLTAGVRERADLLLSLGPMTLPHELARIVLLEQLYRAACINKGVPYHH